MVTFILNNEKVTTELPNGYILLDLLRKEFKLSGTKEGCREGDCGSCMVLLGAMVDNKIKYSPVNSCLLPIGSIAGKHIVTIEGLNAEKLTLLQEAIVDKGATQCGFCTPGMIVSLTGFLLNAKILNEDEALDFIGGNICRCTGYASIIRAVRYICKTFSRSESKIIKTKIGLERIKLLNKWGVLQDYFLAIPERLNKIAKPAIRKISNKAIYVAGGTDVFVKNPEKLMDKNLDFLSERPALQGVYIKDGRCCIGAATTIEELKNSSIIQEMLPPLKDFMKLVSSSSIRFRATLGGNIVNASPIGDLTVILLALDAELRLSGRKKNILLRDFFKGYKKLDKKTDEILTTVSFPVPRKEVLFNFEKISRRTHLDIASVNSAIMVEVSGDIIAKVHLSAGGVAPIPLYLKKTCAYLKGKKIKEEMIKKAVGVADTEISPISDVRGSAKYKRLLLRNLIYAHFITLFPQIKGEKTFIAFQL